MFETNPPDEKNPLDGKNSLDEKKSPVTSAFQFRKKHPWKSSCKPVPKMHRQDFELLECNRALTLTGMSWIGNASLWRMGRKNRIGVFAGEQARSNVDSERCQWAIKMGARRQCLVGTFFTRAEQEILRLHLRHGGRAIWLLGRSFPKGFNTDCAKAIYENRLLVVSCFWKSRWGYSTYRYCTQLVSMCAASLVFWSIGENQCTAAVYRKAMAYGIPVALHS